MVTIISIEICLPVPFLVIIDNSISTSLLIFSYLRGPGYDGLEAEIHEVIQVTQKSSTEVNI